MTRRALLLLPLLALLSACGEEWKPPKKQPRTGSGGSMPIDDQGGFGSERDPTQKDTFGTLITKSDSFILRRQTDYKNYARSQMVADPAQADLDTYEIRVREGRYIPIPAGTRVTKLGTRNFNIHGTICKFYKIEVADGTIKDEQGMGQRGNVPITAFQ